MAGGLCDVCHGSGEIYTCKLCGRSICRNCLTVKGVCRECLSGRTMEAVSEDKIREIGRKLM